MEIIDIEPFYYRLEFPWWIQGDEEGANLPLSWKADDILWGLVSPTHYFEVDASPGIQLLYNILTQLDNAHPERIYYPEPMLKRILEKKKIPLFSLESKVVAKDFDVLGFSLYHERQMLNLLPELIMMQIPYRRENRVWGEHPILICGGIPSMNPEPLADIFDIFCIGEGEEWVVKVNEILVQSRNGSWDRETTMLKIAELQGSYVPEFTSVEYQLTSSGSYHILRETRAGNKIIKKVIVDLSKQKAETFAPIIFSKTKKGNMLKKIEVARGCRSRCRFCTVVSFYAPYRERPLEEIKKAIDLRIDSGVRQISLVAPTPGDYSHMTEVGNYIRERGIKFLIQTGRADNLSCDSVQANRESGKSIVTFAVEVADDDIRKAINKNLPRPVLLEAVKIALDSGFTEFKLQSMIQLPFETSKIAQRSWEDLALEVLKIREELGSHTQVFFSYCPFRPKPFTPFERLPVPDDWKIVEAMKAGLGLVRGTKEGALRVNYAVICGNETARFLEVLFSRGDRRLIQYLEFCHQEHIRCEIPFDAIHYSAKTLSVPFLENAGIPISKFIGGFNDDDDLPWDFIDLGVTKEYFKREMEKAKNYEETPPCFEKCSNCGACSAYPEVPHNALIPHNKFQIIKEEFIPKWEQDDRVPIFVRFHVLRDSELTNINDYKRRLVRSLVNLGIEVSPRNQRLTVSKWKDALNWEGLAIYEVEVYVKDVVQLVEAVPSMFLEEFKKRKIATDILRIQIHDEPKVNLISSARVIIPIRMNESELSEFEEKEWIVKRGQGTTLSKTKSSNKKLKPISFWDVKQDVISIETHDDGLLVHMKKNGNVSELVSLLIDEERLQSRKIKPWAIGYD